jgi:hypothetical protein
MITSLAWNMYSFLQILLLHGAVDVNAKHGHQILVLNLSLLLHMEEWKNIWFICLLTNIGMGKDKPTILYSDNQNVIQFARNSK